MNSRGGAGGKGGTNAIHAFNGTLTVGPNAQVLANDTSPGGAVGASVLASCAAAVESGTIDPADGAGDDVGACGGGPTPLFVSCEESFGITV